MPLDLKALGVTVGVDVGIAAAALALLTVLRAVRPTRRFYAPRRYPSAAPSGAAEGGPGARPRPRPPRLRWWAWLWQLWRLPPERVRQLAGSDGAQYLNALKLGLRISLYLSIWCLAVILPVNLAGSEVDRLIASQQRPPPPQRQLPPPPPLHPPAPPPSPGPPHAAAAASPSGDAASHPRDEQPRPSPSPPAADRVRTPAEAAADAAVAAARATADAAVAAAARFHSTSSNTSSSSSSNTDPHGSTAAAAASGRDRGGNASAATNTSSSEAGAGAGAGAPSGEGAEPSPRPTASPEPPIPERGSRKGHIPSAAEAAVDAAREALNVAAEEAVAVAAEGHAGGGGEGAAGGGGEAAGASTFAAEAPAANGGSGGGGGGGGGSGSGSGTYVFSDLDRLSLANIAPGSPLLWAHLVSVYVVTAIALRVLWQQSKEAVALRVMHVTHAPPGGSSHTARRVLATATLFRFLPTRLRSRLEGAAAGLVGGTRQGLQAAARTADRYLHQVDVVLDAPSTSAATAAACATAEQPPQQAVLLQPAAGGHVATLYAGRVRNVLPVLLAEQPQHRAEVAVEKEAAARDKERGVGSGAEYTATGQQPPTPHPPMPPPGAAATTAAAAAAAAALSLPPDYITVMRAAGGWHASIPAAPPLPSPSGTPSPASPSPSPSPPSTASSASASAASSTAPLLRRRRRQPPAGDGGGGGSGDRSSGDNCGDNRDAYVVCELAAVFPPCRPVALHHLRDERRLDPAVTSYGTVRRALEDLLDAYERQLVAAAAAAAAAGGRGAGGGGGGGAGEQGCWRWWCWRRRRLVVQRRKVRVLGPLLGAWAADLYGVRPVRVDELLHLRTHLEVLYEQVRQGLDEHGHELPYVPTAFVTFSRRWEAAVVSSALWDRDEGVWRAAPAPEPSEVLWGNLRLRLWQLNYREGVLRLVFGALLLTYAVPISALQGLLQVRRLAHLPVFKALVRVPVVRSLLSGLLPGAVLRLLLLLLPTALGRLVRWAGAPSHSQVDFRATTLAFGFQVVAVFLASFVAGTLLNQIGRFVAAPGAVLTVLGIGAPQTASFFLSYILFTGLVVGPLGALRLWGLLLFSARYGLASTRRARARLLAAPAASFAATTPSHSMALLLALVFSCVNPLVLPAAAAHFALAGLLERYAHCYVWAREYESGGRMWSQVFGQVMTGLYLHQAVMTALLSIKQFPWAPLALGAPLAAAAFHRSVVRMYSRPWNTTSLRDAADLDAADRRQQQQQQQQQPQPEPQQEQEQQRKQSAGVPPPAAAGGSGAAVAEPSPGAAASLPVPQSEVVPATVASLDDTGGARSGRHSSLARRSSHDSNLLGRGGDGDGDIVGGSGTVGAAEAWGQVPAPAGLHTPASSSSLRRTGSSSGDLNARGPAAPASPLLLDGSSGAAGGAAARAGLHTSLYLSPARQLVWGAGAAAHWRLVAEANAMDRRLQAAVALAPQPFEGVAPLGGLGYSGGSSNGSSSSDSDSGSDDSDAEDNIDVEQGGRAGRS
ncbi:hypothetical protein HYH02_013447 [Chlamydomonas schloesseri]|uniref:ERD4-related membrane protein n=1 Tax=Chlamydomonas schloesseri TaxID=2026947 RepID=A0A835SQ79_9CHLO|nr:hypothetical protein HYH02_013447 [Chlamydomonas schloesseri]|eukprot:KAG2431317.1 hypothetical protein HYH02_013447 [Chlamydomonas schloesseri]